MREKDTQVLESFFGQLKLRCMQKEWAIHSREGKKNKLRMIALCSSLAAGSTETFFLIIDSKLQASEKGPRRTTYTMKKSFNMAKLSRVTARGTDSVFFEFKGADPLTFVFESVVQRDVFFAASKRISSDASVSQRATMSTGDPLLAPVAREQRYVLLNSDEETRLLAEIDSSGCALNAMLQFESQLKDRISAMELNGAATIVQSASVWDDLLEQINDLTGNVALLEERLGLYASELMSRKTVIESIEHQNNAKRRSRDNVAVVCSTMTTLRDRITLSEQADLVVHRLQQTDENSLIPYVVREMRSLVEAVTQIEAVLNSEGADWECSIDPVPAVTERRELFTGYRVLICHKVKRFIYVICDAYRTEFARDASRRSRTGVLFWQPPSRLFDQLQACGPIVHSLKQCDSEGYVALLRHFAASMQPVFAMEMRSFFKEVRSLVKKKGWRGGFRLGTVADEGDLDGMVESGEIFSVQRSNSKIATPSPALSYRVNSQPTTQANVPTQVSLVLPGLNVAGIRLMNEELQTYASSQFLRNQMEAKSTSKAVTKTLVKVAGTDGGGMLRPDVAFAAVFSTVSDLVLYLEDLLRDTFHVDNEATTSQGRYSPLQFMLTELFSAPDMTLEFSRPSDTKEVHWEDEDDATPESPGTGTKPDAWSGLDLVVSTTSMLENELVGFVEVIVNDCDGCYLLSAISMIDHLLGAIKNRTFLSRIFYRCRKMLRDGFMKFVSDQSSSINHEALKHVGNCGFLGFFSNFPLLISRLESLHACLKNWSSSFYEVFVAHILQLMFAALDELSYVSNTTVFGSRTSRPDPQQVRHGYVVQYRHCAFFVIAAQQFTAETQKLLATRVADATLRRDRYEKLYLTRVILADEFPTLERFTAKAEDLSKAYQTSELVYHEAVSQVAFNALFRNLEKEIRNGVPSAGKRIRRHLSVGVPTKSLEEGFHMRLLQLTWRHFVVILRERVALVNRLPQDLNYGASVECPVSLDALDQIVAACERDL